MKNLDSKTTSLNFERNGLGFKGAEAVAAVLPRTSLTSLNLRFNRIGAEGAAAILTIARGNPSFVTEISGLNNSVEINAVVATNRENLVKQAKIGAWSLVTDHSFPADVAGIMAGYVTSSVDIKEGSMSAIQVELLTPALAEVTSGEESKSICSIS